MDTRTKHNLLVTIIGIILFAALMNLSAVLRFAGNIIRLILPVIVGGILALFVSVPMNGVEKRLTLLFRKAKKQPSQKQLHVLSFVITVICVLLVLILVLTLIVPEIVRSSQSLYIQIRASIPRWNEYLNEHDMNIQWVENLIADIDLDMVMQNISDGIDALLVNIVDVLSSTVNIVVTSAFALIICIYISLGKERLCRHARRLVRAYLKPIWAENVLHFCNVFRRSFSKFLSGQCCEAVILGVLMFLAFTVARLPYGNLVGMLTAVCAIIPYVGAFISCSISVLLTLLIDPSVVIQCLIVYVAVQFIENQFIYPRVVGSSVGLPPLYTLIAAMIGGKLFGIIGIIFFIPLAAVVVELVKEDVEQRMNK